MSNKTYHRAAGYLYTLTTQDYRDILHDAFLLWYDKTGKNIFEEHSGVITKTIKNMFMSRVHARRTFMWRGEIYNKQIIDAVSDYEYGRNVYVPIASDQLSDLIVEESLADIHDGLSDRGKLVLGKLIEGYDQTEIAGMINSYRQIVQYEVKQIKKLISGKMSYTNPFRGSKIVVRKKVGEATWGKRKDHDDFEFETDNEEYQLYVHKESKEGWLVKISNPKSAEFYIKKLVDSKK